VCRWLAYSGSPVLIKELLLEPKHSLIDQSLHSQLGAETTNGDGFGIGWYGVGETPGVFHSIEPAWNDRNPVLHQLSDETKIVVSEPLGDLAGAWNEVPESSYGVIQQGQDELRPFTPRPPS